MIYINNIVDIDQGEFVIVMEYGFSLLLGSDSEFFRGTATPMRGTKLPNYRIPNSDKLYDFCLAALPYSLLDIVSFILIARAK